MLLTDYSVSRAEHGQLFFRLPQILTKGAEYSRLRPLLQPLQLGERVRQPRFCLAPLHKFLLGAARLLLGAGLEVVDRALELLNQLLRVWQLRIEVKESQPVVDYADLEPEHG